MNKQWKPGKQTVELASAATRPSRIRREPPARPTGKPTVLPDVRERETRIVVIGVLLFAIAITFLIFWVSDYTSH